MEHGTTNSRERVAEALDHREPDGVPYDLSSTQVAGINRRAIERWMDLRGFEHAGVELFDVTRQLGVAPEAFLAELGVDFRGVAPAGGKGADGDTVGNADGSREFADEWGLTWRVPGDGLYYDMVRFPLAGARLDEVKRYRFPDGAAPRALRGPRRPRGGRAQG